MGAVSNASVTAEARRDPESPETPELAATGAAGGEVLTIEDLHVEVEGHEILRGVDLVVRQGELHALMGPNGSGKSTLANAIAGNPGYRVASGRILLRGEEVTTWQQMLGPGRGCFSRSSIPRRSPVCRCRNSSARPSLLAVGWTSRCSRSASPSWSGCNAWTWTLPSPAGT